MDHREVLKNIRRIEIKTSRIVDEFLSGQYHSVFRGRGIEFDEVREYSAGDDVRDMDWKVTARYGRPFLKRFREERELTVMLVVDISGSERFGSARLKSELAAEIASTVAFSAIRNNDKVGLLLFTDAVEKYLPPAKGKNHILGIIREVIYFEPERRGTNLARALEYINRVQKRRAVVFLISDFIDRLPEKEVEMANRRHDLIAVSINDRRERELPSAGLLALEDAESGMVVTVDSQNAAFRKTFSALAENDAETRSAFFRAHRVDTIDLFTGADYLKDLIAFFKRRGSRRRA